VVLQPGGAVRKNGAAGGEKREEQTDSNGERET
jgi:hypothetical protein